MMLSYSKAAGGLADSLGLEGEWARRYGDTDRISILQPLRLNIFPAFLLVGANVYKAASE